MAPQPNQTGETSLVKPIVEDARRVVDQLPQAFDVAADESQWLLTLLSADDLRYIFEGKDHD